MARARHNEASREIVTQAVCIYLSLFRKGRNSQTRCACGSGRLTAAAQAPGSVGRRLTRQERAGTIYALQVPPSVRTDPPDDRPSFLSRRTPKTHRLRPRVPRALKASWAAAKAWRTNAVQRTVHAAVEVKCSVRTTVEEMAAAACVRVMAPQDVVLSRNPGTRGGFEPQPNFFQAARKRGFPFGKTTPF